MLLTVGQTVDEAVPQDEVTEEQANDQDEGKVRIRFWCGVHKLFTRVIRLVLRL